MSPTARSLFVMERFFDKVSPEPNSGCWLWTAAIEKNGYAAFPQKDTGKKWAHRIGYELLVGPIPDGMQLDHLCRVRSCVNPRHLEPVTQRVNWMRGQSITRQRQLSDRCALGHIYVPEITRYDSRGHRHCRLCDRHYAAIQHAKERAARG